MKKVYTKRVAVHLGLTNDDIKLKICCGSHNSIWEETKTIQQEQY